MGLKIDNYTNFDTDIQKGKITEIIFEEDFLKFLNIKYINVTKCKQFQVIDSDYLAQIGLHEIKNYYDNNLIPIELHSTYPKKNGWLYTSGADLMIFVSKNTRNMIFLPFKNRGQDHIISISENYKLIINKMSYNNGQKWQSAFFWLPLDDINGYYSVYYKL